jgi:hypothetical protein
MATWAQQKSVPGTGNLYDVCVDSQKIYFLDDGSEGDVYEYVPSTDTLTKILDVSALDANTVAIESIAWFSSELYILAEYEDIGGEYKWLIQKWDGTVNGLTTVYTSTGFTTSTAAIRSGNAKLYSKSGELIALFLGNQATNLTTETVYSTDGSIWNTVTWNTDTGQIPNCGGQDDVSLFTGYPGDIITTRFHIDSSCTSHACFRFNFSTHAWDTIEVDEAQRIKTTLVENANRHWEQQTQGHYDNNLDNGLFPSPSREPLASINMPWSPGTNLSTFEQFDETGNTWTKLDDLPGGWSWAYHTTIVRLSNGDVYAVGFNSNFSTGSIEKRSLPIGGISYGLTHSAGGIPGSII